ncbi:MAG TPA: CorA family divalent cation transporter [Chthoniobacterales bacterium]|jgi:magnesium transporter|nr:CorA family divalent cation transporter [Chthoniobacterales bacterium]
MNGPVSTEPAGQLVQTVHSLEPGKAVYLIEYNAYSHTEKQIDRLENAVDASVSGGVRWLHLQGRPNDETLERFASQFRFHPLVLARFKTDPGRPLVEAYDEQLSVVLQIVSASPTGALVIEPLHLFLQNQIVVTLLANTALDPFQTLRERVRDDENQLRFLRSDYLVYSIFEATLEPYGALIAQLTDRRESLEKNILRDPSPELLPLISHMQRTVTALRQIGLTQAEAWRQLAEDRSGAIGDRSKPFFRFGYSRLLEVIERLQTEASTAANLSNLYLGSLSSRTSESIRMLALVASICLPVITIAMLYAMSFFGHSPRSLIHRWHDTYPIVILLMLVGVVVTFWHFQRRR